MVVTWKLELKSAGNRNEGNEYLLGKPSTDHPEKILVACSRKKKKKKKKKNSTPAHALQQLYGIGRRRPQDGAELDPWAGQTGAVGDRLLSLRLRAERRTFWRALFFFSFPLLVSGSAEGYLVASGCRGFRPAWSFTQPFTLFFAPAEALPQPQNNRGWHLQCRLALFFLFLVSVSVSRVTR